jgi:hypothetical protein
MGPSVCTFWNDQEEVGSWVLVAHAYNPSYLKRQRSGGSWFEASLDR